MATESGAPPPAALARAEAALRERRWDKLLAACREMLAADADDFRALRLLALGSRQARRFKDALRYAGKALRQRPRAWRLIMVRGDAFAALGRNQEALVAYRRALALQPEDLKILFRIGRTQQALKRFRAAIASYDRALALNPKQPSTLLNRGNALRSLGRVQEALESFERALAVRPDHAGALNNAGNALQAMGRYEEAAHNYRKALAANPDYVEGLNNLGNAQQMLGLYREAIANYERVLALSPALHAAKWNKGTTMLHLGLSREAWELYEFRLHSPTHANLAKLALPLLGARPLAGCKLLLQWEARFGDIIQMLRYVPMVEAAVAECWLQVAVPLRDLVARTFPRSRIVAVDAVGGAGYRLPYTSLPLVMETFSEAAIPTQVPYLVPDPARVAHWKRAAAGGRAQDAARGVARIGLAWRGNAVPAQRSMSLEVLQALLELPKLHFVALQKGLTEAERAALQGRSNVTVLDAELTSFDETAAVVAGLDLMISIDSAVAHLAGALGKPVWVMLKLGADWRWMSERGDTPWYPTARLFRQAQLGDWQPVLGAVRKELARFKAPPKRPRRP